MAEEKAADVQPWLNQIAAYEREFKKWEGRADKIIKRYRDESRGKQLDHDAQFNILWSNVQTLVPATFSRLPKPDVSRRFRDNDPIGRIAALILERALDFEVQHYNDYRETLKQCVTDRFLGGRGTCWVRYEPHMKAAQIGQPEDGLSVTEDADEEAEELDYECAPVDYVHWRDFGHSVARTWEEVTTVWRKVYMTREMTVERFGEDGEKIPLDSKPEDQKSKTDADTDSRALVYEMWHKPTKTAIWLSKSLGKILDERADDELPKLEGFWPCPKPLFATVSNETLVPVPDFTLYQDQANALNILADRIVGLIKMLQVKGVYNSEFSELGRLFTEGENGQLLPIKNFAAFAEKQGLKGAIDLVDLQPIYEALRAAYEAFKQQMEQVYDITGLSDIVRGQSSASETATAQQIKSQYASMRLGSMKAGVAEFATYILRLKAQFIVNFEPQSLMKIASVQQLAPEDQQYIAPALELLTQGELRDFRIEIAADSLVQMDESQEKQDRTELLQGIGAALKNALPIVQASPELAPMVLELIKFTVSSFKAGKSVEGVIDQALDQVNQAIKAKQGQPPPTNPEMMKLQAQQQTEQARLAHDGQVAQMTAQQEQQRLQFEAQSKSQEQQTTAAMEQHRNEMEAQRAAQQAQLSAQLEQAKMQHEASLKAAEESFNRWKAELDAATKIMVAEIAAKSALDKAQQSAEQSAAKEMESAAKHDGQASQAVDMHTKTLDALKGVMETLAKPKTVIRDENGRVAGVQ